MTSDVERQRLALLVHEVRSPVAALSAVAEAAAGAPTDDMPRHEFARLAVAAARAIQRIVMDVAVASVRM